MLGMGFARPEIDFAFIFLLVIPAKAGSQIFRE
jgi:hypothetical protein